MKQSTAGFLAALTALSPVPAVALECDHSYSIQQDYWAHKASPDTYILVRGAFSDLKPVEAVEAAEVAEGLQIGREVFSARFNGFRPSRSAFDQAFSTDVTLVFPDHGVLGGTDSAWMAEKLPGQVGLVWLLKTDRGYEATAEPCSDIINPNPGDLKPMLRCLRGGYCPKTK